MFSVGLRHAKSRGHAAIGRGNIFRLRKEKGWNTVEFVETIRSNFMNDVSERSKRAIYLMIF